MHRHRITDVGRMAMRRSRRPPPALRRPNGALAARRATRRQPQPSYGDAPSLNDSEAPLLPNTEVYGSYSCPSTAMRS